MAGGNDYKVKRFLNIVVCLFLVVGTFSACRGGLYMDDFVDVQWTCSNMGLQFTYTADDPEKAIGTIVKDGETIDIACLFSASKQILIYDKAEFDLQTDGIECAALLIGHYKIKDGVATVTIAEDNLFHGDYLDEVIYLQMTPLT